MSTLGTGNNLSYIFDGANTLITTDTGNFVLENINTSGYIGCKLGTTSLTTQFKVANSSDIDQFIVQGNGTVKFKDIQIDGTNLGLLTDTDLIELDIDSVIANGSINITDNTTSTSTTTGALVVSGGIGVNKDIYIGGNSYATSHINTSDERLKTNINPITSSEVEKLALLNPVSFNWKDKCKGKETEFGFIAQEIESYYPNIVKTDGNSMKSMNYTSIIALLVKKVNDLEEKLNKLYNT